MDYRPHVVRMCSIAHKKKPYYKGKKSSVTLVMVTMLTYYQLHLPSIRLPFIKQHYQHYQTHTASGLIFLAHRASPFLLLPV